MAALSLGLHHLPPASSRLLSAACSTTLAASSRKAKKGPELRSLRAPMSAAEAFQVAEKEPGHEGEWQWPAESDGWVLSHDALRLDLADFARLLSALSAQLAAGRPVEAWQAAAIRRYWQQAVHMLVVHHDSEEELYFPLMRTKFPVEAKQSSDHEEIVRLVGQCGAELEGLLGAQGAAQQAALLQPLQADFRRFQALCLEHFREEEEVTLPRLRRHFAPGEVLPVAKKISKLYSLLDMGNYLRPMSHEARVAWMTRVRMPFFVQWLMLAQCWRYDRDVMRPFEAAIQGQKPGFSLL